MRGFHGSCPQRAAAALGTVRTAMRILTVNAGSSSLKLRLLGDDDELLARTDLVALAGRADTAQLREALDGMRGADAIAHRVVHGGTSFTGPVRLDLEITEAL